LGKTYGLFGSLEREESRREESSGEESRVVERRVEWNGYPPPCLDVLKIRMEILRLVWMF